MLKYVLVFLLYIGNLSYALKPTILKNLPSDLPIEVRQLIIVTPKTNITAELNAYEKSGTKWIKASFTPIATVVGKNGIVNPQDKFEGDKKTPAGLYPLGTAFGNLPLRISYPYRQATTQDKFIDDAKSSDYNHWVSGETNATSYEEMLREDGIYNIGIVVDYNMNPVVSGKGSAIFMHIWYGSHIPTTGCVAMDEGNLRKLVMWLNKNDKPYILIKSRN